MRSSRSRGVLPMRSRMFCPIPACPLTFSDEMLCLFIAFMVRFSAESLAVRRLTLRLDAHLAAYIQQIFTSSLTECVQPWRKARSNRTSPIFNFTQPMLTQYSEEHVGRQQSIQSVAGGIPLSQGIPRPEFRRSSPHREIQLRRRTSQNRRR